jgi:hypothetical protein
MAGGEEINRTPPEQAPIASGSNREMASDFGSQSVFRIAP